MLALRRDIEEVEDAGPGEVREPVSELRASRRRLAHFISAVPVGVICWRMDGRITGWTAPLKRGLDDPHQRSGRLPSSSGTRGRRRAS